MTWNRSKSHQVRDVDNLSRFLDLKIRAGGLTSPGFQPRSGVNITDFLFQQPSHATYATTTAMPVARASITVCFHRWEPRPPFAHSMLCCQVLPHQFDQRAPSPRTYSAGLVAPRAFALAAALACLLCNVEHALSVLTVADRAGASLPT